MRLQWFRVQNFMSIKDSGKVILPEASPRILVLAGQNEAGKTALLEALSYFALGPSPKFDRLQKRSDGSLAHVDCQFELSDSDLDHIEKEFSTQGGLVHYLKSNRDLHFSRSQDETTGAHNIDFTTELSAKLKALFAPTQTDMASGSPPGQQYSDLLAMLTSDVLRKVIFYDDTFSNLLPGEITIAEIPGNPAVLDFQTVFGVDFTAIANGSEQTIAGAEKRISRTATDDLNRYWSQKVDDTAKYSFKVKIKKNGANPEQAQILFMIETHQDDLSPSYMEQRSRGFRWFSAFNLRLRALGTKSDHPEDLLLLIDEPGTGLHEKAQQDLKKVIEELAVRGVTVIYSTHNPLLIGTQGSELSRLRLVTQNPRTGSKVWTLAQYASTKEAAAKETLSPIVSAMGLADVGSLKPGGRTVVLEGLSDHYYWTAFTKLQGVTNIYFLPAVGATNVINIAAILFGWGADFRILLDDDRAGRDASAALLKKLFTNDLETFARMVRRVQGASGVEDIFSPSSFATLVLKREIGDEKNSSASVGRKEILARLFMAAVDSGEVTWSNLDVDTQRRINDILTWVQAS